MSEKEQYNRLKQIVPAKVAQQTRVGDLPASFTVKLKNIGKDYGRFAKAFGAATGVAAVQNQISTIKRLLDVIDGARLFSIVIALRRAGRVHPADLQHHPGGGPAETQRDQHHAAGRCVQMDDRAAVHDGDDHRDRPGRA